MKLLLALSLAANDSWIDQRTDRMWAAADNGSGVTAIQARRYCRDLTAGGYRDWRLPSIDELQGIFGGEPDSRGFRSIGRLTLSGWAWSSTLGAEPGEYWVFDFADGGRASTAGGDAGLNRALCVR